MASRQRKDDQTRIERNEQLQRESDLRMLRIERYAIFLQEAAEAWFLMKEAASVVDVREPASNMVIARRSSDLLAGRKVQAARKAVADLVVAGYTPVSQFGPLSGDEFRAWGDEAFGELLDKCMQVMREETIGESAILRQNLDWCADSSCQLGRRCTTQILE
jgi:hypothetical protein